MSAVHLVRVGLLGRIGKFVSAGHGVFQRDAEVVCRTARGLEVGQVVCETDALPSYDHDGELLRKLGREDRVIVERLERFRDRAFHSCQKLLTQRGLSATLVDVEHLFDGQSVWFYFLGDVSSEVESLTEELAEEYESKVKFRKFAETLANGCGPECGTGVSCNQCNGCALGGCGAK